MLRECFIVMKIKSILSDGMQVVRSKKTSAYIEVIGSHNTLLNGMSSKTRQTLVATLRKYYTNVNVSMINDMHDLEQLVAKKPDLVVLGMKRIRPELWVADYLDNNTITYAGSDALSQALEFDKHKAKQVIIDAGLRSSAFLVSPIAAPGVSNTLRFPLFVKPTNLGGSKGIDEQSVVYTNAELAAKVASIHDTYACDVLIEEYLPGREFSVAVVREAQTNTLLSMPIEITTVADTKGNSFLSKAVKSADIEEVIPVDDAELRDRLHALAVGAFEALGARDFGRIDMRLDSDGQPNFIEANLMPGLSDHGYLARCFYINQGTSYAGMLQTIIDLGLARRPFAHDLDVPQNSIGILSVELVDTLPAA